MNEPLPDHFYPDPSLVDTKIEKNHIEKFLKSKLPKSDTKNLEKDLQYTFILDRHSKDNTRKNVRVKRNFLTRKQRKELDLLKLPKGGWDYNSLLGINEMWKGYMRQNLELVKKAPNCQDPEWSNFSLVVAKSELIGANISVVRSKVPSQVGMNGILVLESKMTFQIVTPDSKLKTILKETGVFKIELDNMRFTVFGKHLITRPSERSVRKLKAHMVPDL